MGQFFMHFSLQNIFEKIHLAPEWVLWLATWPSSNKEATVKEGRREFQ